MSPRLLFPEPAVATDVLTFVQRAARLGDGAVRLQATAGLLILTCAPVAPRTLTDATPLILGMRTAPVDPELECDLVVDAASIGLDEAPHALRLPDSAVSAQWAGVTPPRRGWRALTELDADVIAARAQWGIAAVAEQLPPAAGDDVVQLIRSRVWSPADEALAGLPLGVAFAAFGLGFIGGEERAGVRLTDVWARLTLRRGHILARGPVAMGLTPVRRAGRPAS